MRILRINYLMLFITLFLLQVTITSTGRTTINKHGWKLYPWKDGKTKLRFVNLPEEHMNSTEIIKYYGYPCEDHDVITDDGYILSMQRIPHGRKSATNNGIPVLLQHGLIDSSATWINNLPDQSLGFILADQGFDVWLSNSRGNTYSNRHVNISTDDERFWDFSFDEMAAYDLPACIKYILNITKQPQLHYVGHSQGTMIGFAAFSINQELAKKVKTFSALAPVATVSHIKGALKIISNFAPQIEYLFQIFGIKDFFPSNWFMKLLAEVVCATAITEPVCGDIVFLMTGFDTSNLNKTRLPVYIAHTPAGTSVKNIVHFVQLVKSPDKFQKYDYGVTQNMLKYGQPTPPQYNISLMQHPVALFTASNDWLADPYDVEHGLKPYLRNIVYEKNIAEWNHMDFVWGENANKEIYEDIVKLIKGILP